MFKPVQFLSLFTVLMLLVPVVHAKEEGQLTPNMVNPGYHEKPDWFKNSFLDLDEDVAEATEAGKQLIVFFYQDGCPYCKKLLDDNFSQKKIADKTRKYFDLVAVNMWGDKELTYKQQTFTEKTFAETAKVMYTPTILFLDTSGDVVLRMNGYYHPAKFEAALDYVSRKIYNSKKFSEHLVNVMPVKAAGKLHTDVATLKTPYNLKQIIGKSRPLMVMFEQKQCPACDELHLDILKRKESVELLKKFEIAVVEMWGDETLVKPDGKSVNVSKWAKDLNINYAPSIVFFDRKGKEVFRIEGYLKSFHTQSVMDYVEQEAYNVQSNFQRWIDERAHKLRERGIEVNLMD